MAKPSRSPDDSAAKPSPEVLSAAQFATEFQSSYDRLWVLAAAMLGDRHLAEDIVQDSGIVALKRLDEFEVGTSFVAWMSQIVRFQAYNQSRKRTRRSTRSVDPITLDSEASNHPATTQLPDSKGVLPANQTLFDDQVMQALQELSDVARACLLLRTLHQLAYAEIAAMLEIAEGTAMSHVHRSKALLRKKLTQNATKTDNQRTS
ncbi:MAG: RNA polymerase sigma factor [Lacipirellulaceae bacterium]